MAKSKCKKVIKWMKGRGIWTAYCNNTEKSFSDSKNYKKRRNMGEKVVRNFGPYCISFAFAWVDTPEGFSFWSKQMHDCVKKFHIVKNLTK